MEGTAVDVDVVEPAAGVVVEVVDGTGTEVELDGVGDVDVLTGEVDTAADVSVDAVGAAVDEAVGIPGTVVDVVPEGMLDDAGGTTGADVTGEPDVVPGEVGATVGTWVVAEEGADGFGAEEVLIVVGAVDIDGEATGRVG